jgi:hypothetical protein
LAAKRQSDTRKKRNILAKAAQPSFVAQRMHHTIPLIDISPLFGASSLERDLVDQAIMAAAARADAEIRPLPMDGASFEPFFYGDYLWVTTTQFVEFRGMESLRKPMRRP